MFILPLRMTICDNGVRDENVSNLCQEASRFRSQHTTLVKTFKVSTELIGLAEFH